jgi:hypothetical protein
MVKKRVGGSAGANEISLSTEWPNQGQTYRSFYNSLGISGYNPRNEGQGFCS